MFAALIAEASHGEIATVLHTFTTTGDKILDRPLQEAGGKGLFTKELDRAQEVGEIDIAVHSLKDVTVTLPDHLYLATFLEREDPRDCLMGPFASLAELPQGAVVGSSSLRRQAQLLASRPDLKVVMFRGNAQATILAAAGLRRLGMIDKAAGILEIDAMLPAGGQGIIGATLRMDAPDWLKELAAKLDNEEARLAALAERAFLRKLDGSCRTPIAAHFRLTPGGAEMAGELLADDGSRRWRAEGLIEGRPSAFDAEVLGSVLGEDVAAERAYELEGVPRPDDGDGDTAEEGADA